MSLIWFLTLFKSVLIPETELLKDDAPELKEAAPVLIESKVLVVEAKFV